MTNVWQKVDKEEHIHQLACTRAEKLGHVLGMIDTVMLAEEFPEVFNMTEKLFRLRQARKEYDVACAVYMDARLTSAIQTQRLDETPATRGNFSEGAFAAKWDADAAK